MPVDAYRRANELKIEVDIPGADPGSIELTVDNDVLTLRASRTSPRFDADQVKMAERGQGEYIRQLLLGRGLDRDQIAAAYQDGVLTITIPISEQATPRTVEITHGATLRPAEEAVPAGV